MSETQPRTNPNSALYWYPAIDDAAADLPVSVPDTEFVRYEFTESFPLLDADVPDALPWGEFITAVGDVGWPAFVRTDQKSVKHAGPGAYRADEPDDLPTILAVLTDHHVTAQRHPAALMIREFVAINATFRAFDGLPIGREVRVFARPDAVLSDHFYWPADSIADGRGTPTTMNGERDLEPDEWRERLATLESIPEDALADLAEAATTAVRALNDAGPIDEDTAWSVDFAEDTAGNWWLIDAALAKDSWHPEGGIDA